MVRCTMPKTLPLTGWDGLRGKSSLMTGTIGKMHFSKQSGAMAQATALILACSQACRDRRTLLERLKRGRQFALRQPGSHFRRKRIGNDEVHAHAEDKKPVRVTFAPVGKVAIVPRVGERKP
jgi:hypothetical protein